MALCVWFSKLEVLAAKVNAPGVWMGPRAFTLIQTAAPGAATVWATTSCAIALPFALGVASLTSQQILDLDADLAVWARELPAGWRTMIVTDLPLAVRSKILNALTERGIVAGILGTDSLPSAFQKILDASPGMSNSDISQWPQHFRDGLELEPF